MRKQTNDSKKKDKKSEKRQDKTFNEQIRFTNKVIKTGLKTVSQHHIESYDYGLGKCLPRICKYMLPVEVVQLASQTVGKEERTWPFKKYLMWFENFEIRKPQKANYNHSGLTAKLGSDEVNAQVSLRVLHEFWKFILSAQTTFIIKVTSRHEV